MLPAALCMLLAGCIVAQFLLVGAPDLPPEAVGRVSISALGGEIPPVTVPKVIAMRPLFSPTRATGTTPIATAGETVGPLGGAVVSGAITRRGAARAFLKEPNGTIRTISVGGVYAGWRLVAVTGEGVRLARNGQVVMIPFGSAGPANTTNSSDKGDDDASSNE